MKAIKINTFDMIAALDYGCAGWSRNSIRCIDRMRGKCSMSDQQLLLINKAKTKYGAIYPCDGKKEWDECFTRVNGKVIFWFNSRDNSTHIEKESDT
jgi:hypothetical protein